MQVLLSFLFYVIIFRQYFGLSSIPDIIIDETLDTSDDDQ